MPLPSRAVGTVPLAILPPFKLVSEAPEIAPRVPLNVPVVTVPSVVIFALPAHVLSASLYSRFASRNNDEFGNRVLSAMRYKFGGHNEKPKAN